MAEVYVRGGNKFLKNITYDAVQYYMGHLLKKRKRLLANIEIEVIIKPQPLDKHFTSAQAWVEDSDSRPRSFIIETSYRDWEGRYIRLGNILQALAHECVHVKQWATSEMQERYSPQHEVRWHGEVVEDRGGFWYWDLPWELEAMGRERGLYVMFCKSQGYADEKWFNEKGKLTKDW